VDLSTADSNKWLILLGSRLKCQKPDDSTDSDYRLNGTIRQRQRRLTEFQMVEMAEKYEAGSTVYELATEFGCHRTTVSARLKKAGIVMRGQSPTPEVIDSMVRLYGTGLSPLDIGDEFGFCTNTVRNCLRKRQEEIFGKH